MTLLRRAFYSSSRWIIDGIITSFAFYLAYQLRFEWQIPANSAHQLWLLLPGVILGRLLINWRFGTYRIVWRYIGLIDALTLAWSYIAFTAILVVARFGLPASLATLRVPTSIIILDFMISLGGAICARSLRRILYEGFPGKLWNAGTMRRVLLIGAGQAGAMLAKELTARSDLKAVGFLDDDTHKHGQNINGLPILGSLDSLASAIPKYGIEEVIICIAKAPRQTLKRVWAICDSFPVKIKIVPTLEEILDGTTSIAAFRDVELSDLLARDSVPSCTGDPSFREVYRGKRILITGGGGSIGSELAQQLSKLDPSELILLDKDENGLHDTCLLLREAQGIHPVVADLRFPARLESIFSRFRPEIVFHAAAHKHVHLMEMNPAEAILNNVVGTSNLVKVSNAFGVSRFVLISTDKAVKPASIMGASKRLCEMVVESGRNRGSGTKFCCVRFGNVIGSRGSVVPIFQKQIARGGPVTVTHPDVERFLMTIPEAADLLLQAGALGAGGEIFVLDMGEPVLIQDLARSLIELSGLQPGKDVAIQITELKQGEKLREELLDGERELRIPTVVSRIGVVQTQPFDQRAFLRRLERLKEVAQQYCDGEVVRALQAMDIGFRPQAPGIVAEERMPPVFVPPRGSRTDAPVAMAGGLFPKSDSAAEWAQAAPATTVLEPEADHA
ncbi:MAG: polysaccharide biosynthesis protein [Terriglobia bacterium]